MKSIMHFLLQLIIIMGLSNIILLLIPRFIRKGIKNTVKTTYKVIKWIITLAIKQVKVLYVGEDKKKVVRNYTRKSNSNIKKSKQPSNVVDFKPKKSATK